MHIVCVIGTYILCRFYISFKLWIKIVFLVYAYTYAYVRFNATKIFFKYNSRLPQRFILSQNVIEVGSDPSLAPHVGGGHALFLPPNHFIHPRHCVIANTEPGVVTVTPNHPEGRVKFVFSVKSQHS